MVYNDNFIPKSDAIEKNAFLNNMNCKKTYNEKSVLLCARNISTVSYVLYAIKCEYEELKNKIKI